MAVRVQQISPMTGPWPTVEQMHTYIEDLHRRGFRGQGTKINIVDSGVDLNDPQIRAAVRSPGICLVPGYAADDVQDQLGHGTTVARLALLMAPEAEIVPIRIFGAKGSTSDEIAAAGLMEAKKRGHITNASFGGEEPHPALEAAVFEHELRKIPLIAAAGNHGDGQAGTAEWAYPGAYEYCTTVGSWDRGWLMDSALDWMPARASRYSVSHPKLDLIAQGRIPYLWSDGTSWATPLIAGVSACYRSMRLSMGKEWNDQVNYNWLIDNTHQLAGYEPKNDQTGYGAFTCRPHSQERVLEIDVDTLECFLDSQHLPELKEAADLINKPPGGMYGYLRPILEVAAKRVGYDAARRRARYWL